MFADVGKNTVGYQIPDRGPLPESAPDHRGGNVNGRHRERRHRLRDPSVAPLTTVFRCVTGSFDRHDPVMLKQFISLIPFVNLSGPIATDKKNDLHSGSQFLPDRVQRMDCVGQSVGVDLDAGCTKAVVAGDRQFNHPQAILRGCQLILVVFMGRCAGWHEENLFQFEFVESGLGEY